MRCGAETVGEDGHGRVVDDTITEEAKMAPRLFENEPTMKIDGAKRVLDMTVIFPPVNVFDEVLNRPGITPIYREFAFDATQ
jgi:hypothetical protein